VEQGQYYVCEVRYLPAHLAYVSTLMMRHIDNQRIVGAFPLELSMGLLIPIPMIEPL
jgi:hypothetical protein